LFIQAGEGCRVVFVLMAFAGLLFAGALLFLFWSNKSKKSSSKISASGSSSTPPRPASDPRSQPRATATLSAQSSALPAAVKRPSFEAQAAALLAAQQAAQSAREQRHPAKPMPPELATFVWQRAEDLPTERQQRLLDGLRQTPPPSRAFHQLISPQFVARASSSELSDLVIGEAQVAAKVLVVVNSAAYSLQSPVSSIGQAVTFLGLNSVRGICLRYMLSASFKAESPAQQRRFDEIWLASAVASELCFRLAQQLRLPDPGALVTQVVLSFLGHFVAAASMPKQGAVLAADPKSLLARAELQQASLGLPAAEMGGLLLQQWALPPSLITDVLDIDRLLVTPPSAHEASRAAALAVGYLSARLGEMLSGGEPVDLSHFDPRTQPEADFYQLAAYIDALPALARLLDVLHSPDLSQAVQTLLSGMRTPA
jgi:HD-like signal output (HDOD) protein